MADFAVLGLAAATHLFLTSCFAGPAMVSSTRSDCTLVRYYRLIAKTCAEATTDTE